MLNAIIPEDDTRTGNSPRVEVVMGLTRDELIGKGLRNVESGRYLGKILDFNNCQLVLESGLTISYLGIGFYQVVPVQSQEKNEEEVAK